jgi:hypothetical protein
MRIELGKAGDFWLLQSLGDKRDLRRDLGAFHRRGSSIGQGLDPSDFTAFGNEVLFSGMIAVASFHRRAEPAGCCTQ